MRIVVKILLIFGIAIESGVIIYFGTPLVLKTPVSFIRIQSDSMVPALEAGDMILVNGRGKDDISSLIDKIIAFYDPTSGKIIVHRAVGEKDGCLITKGDSNAEEDFFRPCGENVLGRVVYH